MAQCYHLPLPPPRKCLLNSMLFLCFRMKERIRLCAPLKLSSLSCRTKSKVRSKVQRISLLRRRNTKRFLSANSSCNKCDDLFCKIILLYRFFFMKKLQYNKSQTHTEVNPDMRIIVSNVILVYLLLFLREYVVTNKSLGSSTHIL